MRTKLNETEASRAALEATRTLGTALLREEVLSDEGLREVNAAFVSVGLPPLSAARPDGPPATATMEPEQIRELRGRLGVGQAALAESLGVAVGTLSQWERGLRKPDGPALRLLSLIQRHGLDYVR